MTALSQANRILCVGTPIVGVGASTFSRGVVRVRVCWIIPLVWLLVQTPVWSQSDGVSEETCGEERVGSSATFSGSPATSSVEIESSVEVETSSESDETEQTAGLSQQLESDAGVCVRDAWGLAEGDELWVVSSRHVGCPSDDTNGLKYYRRVDQCWELTDRAAFDGSESRTEMTVVFVHGNRTDFQWASRRGLQAYDSFIKAGNPGRRVRYVIWSWPSEQKSGPVRDFRMKANRAKREGILFGSFLAGLDSTHRVSLIGYSYGSKIVLGGVHLLSGNPLFGQLLSLPEGYRPPPLRITLIAAATNNTSLMPNSSYGDAYPLIDRLLLVNNSADRALRLYRWVDKHSKIPALGSAGLVGRNSLDDLGEKITQFDFARQIGNDHSLELYFRSGQIRRLVTEQVFCFEDGPTPQATRLGSASR